MPLTPPTLRTERLQLRPVVAADREDLFELLSDRESMVYWDSPPWTEMRQADAFLERVHAAARDGRGVRVAVTVPESGAFVGFITLGNVNAQWRSAELGYCVKPEWWGRGYATEAAAAVVEWAFSTLDLIRIQAELDTRNVASARVVEKVGFLREGHLRQNCIVEGVVSDSFIYGLLVTDWRTRQQPAPR